MPASIGKFQSSPASPHRRSYLPLRYEFPDTDDFWSCTWYHFWIFLPNLAAWQTMSLWQPDLVRCQWKHKLPSINLSSFGPFSQQSGTRNLSNIKKTWNLSHWGLGPTFLPQTKSPPKKKTSSHCYPPGGVQNPGGKAQLDGINGGLGLLNLFLLLGLETIVVHLVPS